eukprot:817959-Rhodomonas_salina.2
MALKLDLEEACRSSRLQNARRVRKETLYSLPLKSVKDNSIRMGGEHAPEGDVRQIAHQSLFEGPAAFPKRITNRFQGLVKLLLLVLVTLLFIPKVQLVELGGDITLQSAPD